MDRLAALVTAPLLRKASGGGRAAGSGAGVAPARRPAPVNASAGAAAGGNRCIRGESKKRTRDVMVAARRAVLSCGRCGRRRAPQRRWTVQGRAGDAAAPAAAAAAAAACVRGVYPRNSLWDARRRRTRRQFLRRFRGVRTGNVSDHVPLPTMTRKRAAVLLQMQTRCLPNRAHFGTITNTIWQVFLLKVGENCYRRRVRGSVVQSV